MRSGDTEVDNSFDIAPEIAPTAWKDSCVHSESTIHQLSPYIGKLKSSIAGQLIEEFTKASDLIVDPFAGAGTIPLEAAIRRRNVIASDLSPYATLLCRAKLNPPTSLDACLADTKRLLEIAKGLPKPDLRRVPVWVRSFFHPRTLGEAIQFAQACKSEGNDFVFACLLGILHHQRPGFLSFPSSHLVPYLRTKSFPKDEFPSLYKYRPVEPRILKKVQRALRRHKAIPNGVKVDCRQQDIRDLVILSKVDCIVTSPPYMNALDYRRDNRLRMWFIDPQSADNTDDRDTRTRQAFAEAITSLATLAEVHLKKQGHAILVVGEQVVRSGGGHPSAVVHSLFQEHAPSLSLTKVIADNIPDVRRARRELAGTKTEHVMIYRRD